jgi:hypothetical protein
LRAALELSANFTPEAANEMNEVKTGGGLLDGNVYSTLLSFWSPPLGISRIAKRFSMRITHSGCPTSESFCSTFSSFPP